MSNDPELKPEQNKDARSGANMHKGAQSSSNTSEPVQTPSNMHEPLSENLENTQFSSKLITIAETKKLFEASGLIRSEVTLRRYCKKGKMEATQIEGAVDGSSPWLVNEASAMKYIAELLQTYGSNQKKSAHTSANEEKQARTGSNEDTERLWKTIDRLHNQLEQKEITHEAQMKRKDEALQLQMETSAIWGALAREMMPTLQDMSDEEVINKFNAKEIETPKIPSDQPENSPGDELRV